MKITFLVPFYRRARLRLELAGQELFDPGSFLWREHREFWASTFLIAYEKHNVDCVMDLTKRYAARIWIV